MRPAVTYQFRIYADNELGRSQASDVGIGQNRAGIYKSNLPLVDARFVADTVLPHPQPDSRSFSPPRIKTIGTTRSGTSDDRYARVKKAISPRETNLSLFSLFLLFPFRRFSTDVSLHRWPGFKLRRCPFEHIDLLVLLPFLSRPARKYSSTFKETACGTSRRFVTRSEISGASDRILFAIDLSCVFPERPSYRN